MANGTTPSIRINQQTMQLFYNSALASLISDAGLYLAKIIRLDVFLEQFAGRSRGHHLELPFSVCFCIDHHRQKSCYKLEWQWMDAGFESQWDAAWFRVRAEQCFRLAASLTQTADAAKLRDLGQDFEAQARLAQEMQLEVQSQTSPAI